MGMVGMQANYLWSSGDYTSTGHMDVKPPIYTLGFLALSKTGGDGQANAGFLGFDYQGGQVRWSASRPTAFAHDKVTRVYFEVWSYDAYGYATIVLTYWS